MVVVVVVVVVIVIVVVVVVVVVAAAPAVVVVVVVVVGVGVAVVVSRFTSSSSLPTSLNFLMRTCTSIGTCDTPCTVSLAYHTNILPPTI